MLLKTCTKCKRILKLKEKCKYCSKVYHTNYDNFNRDSNSVDFYHSKTWVALRESVLEEFNYIDLYEYVVNNKIIKADTVHHIVPFKDNYDLALDRKNLIPVSNGNHTIIHKLYNSNEKTKEKTQKLLFNIINNFKIK